MKKAENTAMVIYLFSLPLAFFPFLILICNTVATAIIPVLFQTFLLSALIVFLNRLTPKKHNRFLSYFYTFAVTMASFLINHEITFFYRLLVSMVVFIISIFSQIKKENLVSNIYTFTAISFANTIICFIFSYSLPEKSMVSSVFSYLIFATTYGLMSYCKSNAEFLKKSSSKKMNFSILIIPFITLVITAILAFPLSKIFSETLLKILRIFFSNTGGGNTTKPQTESIIQSTEAAEVLPIEQSNIARYIFIALIFAMILFFIIYLRHEITEFFRNLPRNIKRKIKAAALIEKTVCNDEYTDIISSINQSLLQTDIIVSPEKMWQKRFKTYRREKWSQQKLKDGFELAENGLRLCNIEISNGDTVVDIEKKLPPELKSLWHKAAQSYMNLKYHEISPAKEEEVFFNELIDAVGLNIKKLNIKKSQTNDKNK